jgi:hypothetical protein
MKLLIILGVPEINYNDWHLLTAINLNQQPVSQGKPGAIWQQMNALFQSHKQQLI